MAMTKLTLSMGVMSAQVKLLKAVKGEDDEQDVETRTVCAGTDDEPHAPTRVNSLYRCSHCKTERSSYHPFKRGKELADGTFELVDISAAAEVDRSITHELGFLAVPLDSFEATAVPSGNVYYVLPDGKPEIYAAIRDVMRSMSDEVAWVAQWAPRSAATPIRALFMGDLLAIQQYAWPRMLKDRPLIAPHTTAEAVIELGKVIAADSKVAWSIDTFVDTRKAALAERIAAVTSARSAVPTGVDGAQALLLSMQEYVAARDSAKPKPARKPAAKKPAAVKATAPPRKRTTRKRTTVKEDAA